MNHKNEPLSEEKIQKRNLTCFTFLHGLNDMHSTSLPTIIPMLVQSIGLSMSGAGMLNAVFGITNIFAQPITGYFADRQRRPWFAVWGPMISASGACLLPMAPSYGAALLTVGMMSMGTALFHPQGTGKCGSSAGKNNLAFCISLFAACGSFGSAIGPLYVVFMISLLGKTFFPLMLLPIFAICLYIWHHTSAPISTELLPQDKADITGFISNIKYLLSKVGGVVMMASLRDATFQGIKIFLPMLIITRGGTIAAGGFSLFAITLAGTAAGIAGGKLADTVGDERILIASMSVSPIFILASLHTAGLLSLALLMAGFALLQTSCPVTTAMAQKRCPESRSTVSSLALGVSWGIANLCTTPVGFSADIFGLEPTLNVVALFPWLATAHALIKKYSSR